MALRLPEHWLWDFWFAVDGEDVHVFFLQAPRELGDPALRHHSATIGHAVSRDLRRWEVLPAAIGRGDPGAFDDLSPWTGSVVRRDGRWHLFYTGISTAEGGAVQRVGLAVSEDLLTWRRLGVVLEADPRWYETRAGGAPVEHWRDPWVAWDPERRRFDMLLCARVNRGPADARGVIGHATSPDLRHWEARPPLSAPGEFFQLEVPQLAHVGGAWRILFCTMVEHHAAARLSRAGVVAQSGTHYLTARTRLGPYALDRDDFLAGDPDGRHYAGRLLHHRGAWWFFAWRLYDAAGGGFVGELSDPMPVTVAPDGSLGVARPPLG